MHEPAPVKCTVEPVTVQLPPAENETDNPDEAVADTVKSGSPKVFAVGPPKLIVWSVFPAHEDG